MDLVGRAVVIVGVALAACGGGGGAAGWDEVEPPAGVTAPLDVWVFSETDVWIVDGTPNVHRYDGATWTTVPTPASGGLGCIFARSPTQVWLCAGDEVVSYDGVTFTATDVATPTGLSGITALWASGPDDVWVVGFDAIVGHFDGVSWRGTLAGDPDMRSIWGSGPGDVYAGGSFALIHHDGAGWSEVDTGPGGGGADGEIFGTGPDDVWIATGSSELLHFDGAGWTEVYTDFVGEAVALWGPASDDLWGVGDAGSISHYDGEAWSELTHQRIGAPYLRRLTAVHGSSATHVWAVGQELGEGGSTPRIYRRGP